MFRRYIYVWPRPDDDTVCETRVSESCANITAMDTFSRGKVYTGIKVATGRHGHESPWLFRRALFVRSDFEQNVKIDFPTHLRAVYSLYGSQTSYRRGKKKLGRKISRGN